MSRDPIVPRVELEILRGQAREKRRPVSVPAFLIGASHDCDLVLAAKQFPDVYAYLIVHAAGVSVRHLGFAPELLVNGQLVTEAELAGGDRLQAGPYEFAVHIAHEDTDGATTEPRHHLPHPKWDSESPATYDNPLRAAVQLVHDIRVALSPPEKAIRRPA